MKELVIFVIDLWSPNHVIPKVLVRDHDQVLHGRHLLGLELGGAVVLI